MNNAGTGNLDIGFWFIFWMMLPISLAFLQHFMWAIVNLVPVPETKTIEVEVPVERIVYRDRVITPKTKNKVPERSTPEPTPEPTPVTSPLVISETISGLSRLGFSKKDAKAFTEQVASSRVYPDTESLLTDCLSQLK